MKAKKLRNEGKVYVDRKGKTHKNKRIVEYNHQCRYKCNTNIPEDVRKEIFNEYWKTGNWELQSAFLNGAITLNPVSRKSTNAIKNKSVSCVYSIGEFRVCQKFFKKTLCLSNKRIQNIVNKKKMSVSGVSPRDNRGKKIPANKISEERVNIIKEHINKYPKYTSHYTREKNPNRKFLPTGLTIKEMYKAYQEFCNTVKHVEPEKESFYRHIFNTKFNLSFHRPNTDTCDICDKLTKKIEFGTPEQKQESKNQKELHLGRAEAARLAKDNAKHIEDNTHISICFDLQKTLPTPNLSNQKAYYFRQLWTYNLAIHELKTGMANMYMWHEAQASRGCKEIASCLFKFIKSIPSTVKHITCFTNNCGGQNKSQIIVKFWLYVVRTTNIETVNHRFFCCGHSYNEYDQDFCQIELKKRRIKESIYIPEHWYDLVSSTSKKFIVVKMEDKVFIDLESLQPHFKKSVPGIRQMQWLHFEKSSPDTLYFKHSAADGLEMFSEMSMKVKNCRGRQKQFPKHLPTVKEKPVLKPAKVKDLLDQIQYIPPIHHQFYKNLTNNPLYTSNNTASREDNQTEDNVEASEMDLFTLYDTDED